MSLPEPSMPFSSFEAFWPHYVREHRDPRNRRLHVVGTSAALTAVALGVLRRRPGLVALAPVCGYLPAWCGHFFVEKNRPATFDHPLWSLRADFVMFRMVLAGTMDAEVERCVAAPTQGNGSHAPAKPAPSVVEPIRAADRPN